MTDRILQIQVLFELSMSIGNSSDFHTMISTAITEYLQNLTCFAGAVVQFDKKNTPCLIHFVPYHTHELAEFIKVTT